MDLTEDQIAADAFLRRFESSGDSMACLDGPAGSGKTTVVARWLQDVQREQLCVAAPTHKALSVLKGKCGRSDLPFRTVSSLLGEEAWEDEGGKLHFATGEVDRNADELLVVVDECSMVSKKHLALLALFDKVLFVGDSAQVPPIGEALSESFTVHPKFTLTKIVRQAAGSPVIGLSQIIRERMESPERFVILPHLQQGLSTDNRFTMVPAAHLYDFAVDAWKRGMVAPILAHTNKAVDAHNAVMHARLYPDAPLFGVGEPVVSESTKYANNGIYLHSGERCIVEACEPGEPKYGMPVYSIHLKRDSGERVSVRYARPDDIESLRSAINSRLNDLEREVHSLAEQLRRESVYGRSRARADGSWDSAAYGALMLEQKELRDTRSSLAHLCRLRHAYATTVYKAQGSTYDAALIDWKDIAHTMARSKDPRVLYTAVTRPRDWLVIFK